MIKLATVRTMTNILVATSTAFITNAIIKNNVPNEKLSHKVQAWVGGSVIGLMAADMTTSWSDRTFDKVVKSFQDAKLEDTPTDKE